MEDTEDEPQNPFSLLNSMPDIIFRDEDSDDQSNHSSSSDPDEERRLPVSISGNENTPSAPSQNQLSMHISPESHISSQFYTFNRESHALMVRCIIEHRLATADEIRLATPRTVLNSWRAVWKDRNEDTAYLTAWKRIQDKLNAHVDDHGNQILCFKNNTQQCVSHVDQWQDIVMSFHGDADLKHLGLKETIERIKQVWTVGAKFYGIPESFIRVCVASCSVCSDSSSTGGVQRSKRRRFEYTESFEISAKEVPRRLQLLAAKHKVVLCIRQKYIRYKPFMAEVKDYACHRAGEPATKRSRAKREPYASKRCGCGFRIRAIVPIANYNEKDKTFVYQEEGMAVFKLYAVHTGHEPGPLDGNARIIHRVVGHKGTFSMDQEPVYGLSEETDTDTFSLLGKAEADPQTSVLHQLQELRVELDVLEGKITKFSQEMLGSVSRELSDIVLRIRGVRESSSRSMGLLIGKQHGNEVLVGDTDLRHWGSSHHDQIYSENKDGELIEEDEDTFNQTLADVGGWDGIRTDCRNSKVLIRDSCKTDKWLKDACGDFDEKTILGCEDSKLIKPIRHDGSIVSDTIGIQVDGFYSENSKWYDSPCNLDSNADCGDGGFRHDGIV